MGSPPSEKGRSTSEEPQHTVTFGEPFAVSKFQLTFDEWDACADYGDCGRNIGDNGWGKGQRPVINVAWVDAQQYVNWLSKATGKPYRLLSEAEYEYAARGGMQAAYSWGDNFVQKKSNCNGCGNQWDGRQTAPVGSFPANGFGLNDMAGNVLEWVEDCMHPNYSGAPVNGTSWIAGGDCNSRMARGGGWVSPPDFMRSAWRVWGSASNRGRGCRIPCCTGTCEEMRYSRLPLR